LEDIMSPWLILSALVALALVYVAVPVAVAAFRQWRRPWRLTCPRAGAVAQIRVDAVRASLAEVLGQRPEIDHCSLWPALLGCRQECLALPSGERRQMRRGEAPPRQRADDAIRLIVVPLDGSPGGEAMLPAVAEIARGWGATLRLLRVVPPVNEVRGDDDHVVAYVDQETTRVVTEARDYLRRVAVGLGGLPIEEAVRIGDATTEIVEESDSVGADLIALATHRRGRLGRALDRRMARRLQQATTIPILIVPDADPVAA
jgi:nucleotide-binding universal stress UspA family protein